MPVSLPRRYATFLLSLMVAVLATVLLTVAITLRAGSEAQPTPAPLPVAVLPFVEENRYTEAIQLSGIVQAKARAQLAFEVPGLLLDLTVEEGSAVTAGQILGRRHPPAAGADKHGQCGPGECGRRAAIGAPAPRAQRAFA